MDTWLTQVALPMPWDSAMPGKSTADVSLKRLLGCEAARYTGKHRMTLFMDLSAFYEHIDHRQLIEDARALGFPENLLYLAMSVYTGQRIISIDGLVFPAVTATRGILAGDPLAPILAKVALYQPLKTVLHRPFIKSADVWVDDISVGNQNGNPDKVAAQAHLTFTLLRRQLQLDGHVPDDNKTFFLASSPLAASALQRKLKPGDPQIRKIGEDLGMSAAAARKKTVRSQRQRLAKANKRFKRLKSFRVKDDKKKIRAFSASVVAAGIWGHQAQGISPKVQNPP